MGHLIGSRMAARMLGISLETMDRTLRDGRYPGSVRRVNGYAVLDSDDVAKLRTNPRKTAKTKITFQAKDPDVTT